eukprot:m.435383 g.435383  ORF g.435383 m.435383 type:complete len:328 (+) comp17841_c0_seq1:62-1045(+)
MASASGWAEEMSFYQRLQLTRSATVDEINLSFRRLALEFHPDKNSSKTAEGKFGAVCEAYTVLSNPKLRATYDTFGLNGLRNGAPKGDSVPPVGEHGYTEGWTYHGDHRLVFRNFFGGENPFDDLFPKKLGDEFDVLPVLEPRTKKIQEPPVEETLLLSLEEAYLGCMKKMKLERREVLEPGGTSSKKSKILTINVKPGWKEGTKITFPKDGDQDPNRIPSDIVFRVKYKEHPRFRRVGNDLIHLAKISLADALSGCIVELLMLDDRTLNIPVSDVVSPGYQLKVPGEGMPVTKGGKGDLILHFDVTYPTSLSENQKALIRQGLSSA